MDSRVILTKKPLCDLGLHIDFKHIDSTNLFSKTHSRRTKECILASSCLLTVVCAEKADFFFFF